MSKLDELISELRNLENKEGLEEALEILISTFSEERGYVYVLYMGDGRLQIYTIRRTTKPELITERVVRIIKTENAPLLEKQLHEKFSSKKIDENLFKLNDEDVLYIHMIEEDPHLSLF